MLHIAFAAYISGVGFLALATSDQLKIGTTFPTFLMEDGKVNGYPVLDTNQAAEDLVYFGVWSQCVLGLWGGVSLLVDPFTQAGSGLIRIHTEFFADVGVLQPTAFVVSTDSGAQ